MIRPDVPEIVDQLGTDVRTFSDTCARLRALVGAVEQAHEDRQRRQRETVDELNRLASELEAAHKKRLAAYKKKLDQHARTSQRQFETLGEAIRDKLDTLANEAKADVERTLVDERERFYRSLDQENGATLSPADLEPRLQAALQKVEADWSAFAESARERVRREVTDQLAQAREMLTTSLEEHLEPLRQKLTEFETNTASMAIKVRGILEEFRDRTKAELESIRGRINRDNAWVGHLAEDLLQLKTAVAQLTTEVETLRAERQGTPQKAGTRAKPRS